MALKKQCAHCFMLNSIYRSKCTHCGNPLENPKVLGGSRRERLMEQMTDKKRITHLTPEEVENGHSI